eukprot:TRINITY_DN9328_c0_g2_i1.p1 TRINITY_DN9328_c0_g2~~TRINITY_DN9328_c0_g2_i1.p1  ORF type:complete len:468 (+),score=79.74 TRINITY_DN9328_c0_g2_i1:83-1486(+)
MASTKAAPRGYLIGGDGFHRMFWPSLAIAYGITHSSVAAAFTPLAIVHEFWRESYNYLLDQMMRGAHSMMWWSLFGLLSSSCCALQLILNLFNFGCAGFNTYLGPVRPIFLAITITLNIRMWELALPNLGLPSTPDYYLHSLICSTILAVVLSLLPELTEFRNKRAADSNASTLTGSAAPSGILTEAVISLEGLGCVACTSAVQGALKKAENEKVVGIAVALEEKEARITFSCDEHEAKDSIVPDLISRIQAAGFEATLTSIGEAKASSDTTIQTLESTGGIFQAIGAGLLGSSCCLLQLGVNLLATLDLVHVGCAGFNKVLGPWRLHLRALTFAWLGYLWFRNVRAKDCCKGSQTRLIFNTVLCLSLTFLPEVLRASGGSAIAPPTDGADVIKLKIDGMGCEACEAHVRNVVDRSSGVIGSRADFKGGFAEIEVAKDWGFNLTKIVEQLKEDGYEASMPVPEKVVG